MEIQELQQQASAVFLQNLVRDNIAVTDQYLILKLTEEVGEFVQSYLIQTKNCRPEKYRDEADARRETAKELADILGIVFVLARQQGIDLEEALTKKWITREWLKK